MRRQSVEDRLTLRALMLQHVAESKLDEAREFLLKNLIETYFKLAAEEKEGFSRLLMKSEYREAQEMELTWADEMREEGRKEGIRTGLLVGKREALKHLLAKKFGPLPQETVSRLDTLESLDELDVYLDCVLSADSLEEMGLEGA